MATDEAGAYLRRISDSTRGGAMQPERFKKREGDRWWHVLFASMLRSPVVAKTIFTIVGSLGIGTLVSMGVLRFLVLDRVLAQDRDHGGRMTQIEAAASVDRARVDSLEKRVFRAESTATFTVKDICNRYSKRDQEWLGIACSANIYKGAPRDYDH